MNFIDRAYAAWSAFWHVRGDPHGLALFRILFGLFWLVRWSSWAPHVRLLFSAEGFHLPAFEPPVSGVHDFQGFIGWVTQPQTLVIAWCLFLLAGTSILLITLGFLTRAALITFFLLLNYYYYLYLHMHGTSYDRLFLIITFLLCLCPCNKAYALDARSPRGPSADIPWPLWTQRMICVQIAVVYFATGVHKLTSPAWRNGDNIAASLYCQYSTALGQWIGRLGIPEGYFDLANIVLILFELLAGFLLFSRKWQTYAFVGGGLFHLICTTVLWIPEFLIVPCTYVLFVPPERIKNIVADLLPTRVKLFGTS